MSLLRDGESQTSGKKQAGARDVLERRAAVMFKKCGGSRTGGRKRVQWV